MIPLLIAHRGDTINFPENTMLAFESAIQKGAHGIEMDVHLNNDQIIVVHDYNFDKHKTYPLLETVLEKFGQKGFKVHGHIYSDKVEEYNKIVELGFDKATFDKITLLEKIFPQ